MAKNSHSERADALTLRMVGGVDGKRIHLCMAHPGLTDGSIVTLEGLCRTWAYDVLSHAPIERWRQHFPEARMCPACWVKYRWLPV